MSDKEPYYEGKFSSDHVTMLWWATELRKAYVHLRKLHEPGWRGLPEKYEPVSAWFTLATKVISIGCPEARPLEIMNLAFSALKPPAPFALFKTVNAGVLRTHFGAAGLSPEDEECMRANGLDPVKMEDVFYFRTVEKVLYWRRRFQQNAGTTDENSDDYKERLWLNLIAAAPWVVYALGHTDPRVCETYGPEATEFFFTRPDIGAALVRHGVPETATFPRGRPNGY